MPPVIRLVWVDSLILDHGDWMDAPDTEDAMTEEGMIHHTVGFLVRENDTALCIAGSLNQGFNRCCGTIVVPKSAILRREDA